MIPNMPRRLLPVLGMDEWTRQYPELHPDQLRVIRLNHTEEIYSPQVEVKD